MSQFDDTFAKGEQMVAFLRNPTLAADGIDAFLRPLNELAAVGRELGKGGAADSAIAQGGAAVARLLGQGTGGFDYHQFKERAQNLDALGADGTGDSSKIQNRRARPAATAPVARSGGMVDVATYLRQHHDNIVLGAIEEASRASEEDVVKGHLRRQQSEWSGEGGARSRFLESLGIRSIVHHQPTRSTNGVGHGNRGVGGGASGTGYLLTSSATANTDADKALRHIASINNKGSATASGGNGDRVDAMGAKRASNGFTDVALTKVGDNSIQVLPLSAGAVALNTLVRAMKERDGHVLKGKREYVNDDFRLFSPINDTRTELESKHLNDTTLFPTAPIGVSFIRALTALQYMVGEEIVHNDTVTPAAGAFAAIACMNRAHSLSSSSSASARRGVGSSGNDINVLSRLGYSSPAQVSRRLTSGSITYLEEQYRNRFEGEVSARMERFGLHLRPEDEWMNNSSAGRVGGGASGAGGSMGDVYGDNKFSEMVPLVRLFVRNLTEMDMLNTSLATKDYTASGTVPLPLWPQLFYLLRCGAVTDCVKLLHANAKHAAIAANTVRMDVGGGAARDMKEAKRDADAVAAASKCLSALFNLTCAPSVTAINMAADGEGVGGAGGLNNLDDPWTLTSTRMLLNDDSRREGTIASLREFEAASGECLKLSTRDANTHAHSHVHASSTDPFRALVLMVLGGETMLPLDNGALERPTIEDTMWGALWSARRRTMLTALNATVANVSTSGSASSASASASGDDARPRELDHVYSLLEADGGAQRFDPQGTNPCKYAVLLILLQRFSEAVAHLYYGGLTPLCVNMSTILMHYGLLAPQAMLRNGGDEDSAYLSSPPTGTPLWKVVSAHVSALSLSAPEAAVDRCFTLLPSWERALIDAKAVPIDGPHSANTIVHDMLINVIIDAALYGNDIVEATEMNTNNAFISTSKASDDEKRQREMKRLIDPLTRIAGCMGDDGMRSSFGRMGDYLSKTDNDMMLIEAALELVGVGGPVEAQCAAYLLALGGGYSQLLHVCCDRLSSAIANAPDLGSAFSPTASAPYTPPVTARVWVQVAKEVAEQLSPSSTSSNAKVLGSLPNGANNSDLTAMKDMLTFVQAGTCVIQGKYAEALVYIDSVGILPKLSVAITASPSNSGNVSTGALARNLSTLHPRLRECMDVVGVTAMGCLAEVFRQTHDRARGLLVRDTVAATPSSELASSPSFMLSKAPAYNLMTQCRDDGDRILTHFSMTVRAERPDTVREMSRMQSTMVLRNM